MGNCSSPLRRHMRHNNTAGVLRVVQEAGEGSPDLINEDFTADCILDTCQQNNNTPLHTAMSYHQHDILEILLQYGGDPNTPSRYFGQTVLHQASRQNNLYAIQIILKYNGDVHATDNEGRIPLHCAAGSLTGRVKNNADTVHYLLEEVGKAADLNVQDASGNTPLHAAIRAEHICAVQYLLSKGADLNIANTRGQSPGDLINTAKGDFKLKVSALQQK